jgi:hypothetical protein
VGEKRAADDKAINGVYVCEPLSVAFHGSQSLQPHDHLETGIVVADIGIDVIHDDINVSS